MSALAHPSRRPDPLAWQGDVTQLLDEHHLAAWSDCARTRLAFGAGFYQFLRGLKDTEVCVLFGRHIVDMDSLCHQLERAIPGRPLERRLHGPRGVAAHLRSRNCLPGRRASRWRFYLWHDADVLLRENPKLFGLVADTMAGIAAEAEYVCDDLLLLHRTVYLGGTMLDVYSEDERGQFRSWYQDGLGEPFWKVVTGIDAPSVVSKSIERIANDLHVTA